MIMFSHWVVYRGMYLINWVYRWLTESGYNNWISWLAGAIQTIIYCDFFYYYAVAKLLTKDVITDLR